jgi:hypothetical protein
MQFNNPASTKNENKKNDNSTLKKIDGPVAFAARFFLARQPRRHSERPNIANIATPVPFEGMQQGNYVLQQHPKRDLPSDSGWDSES